MCRTTVAWRHPLKLAQLRTMYFFLDFGLMRRLSRAIVGLFGLYRSLDRWIVDRRTEPESVSFRARYSARFLLKGMRIYSSGRRKDTCVLGGVFISASSSSSSSSKRASRSKLSVQCPSDRSRFRSPCRRPPHRPRG